MNPERGPGSEGQRWWAWTPALGWRLVTLGHYFGPVWESEGKKGKKKDGSPNASMRARGFWNVVDLEPGIGGIVDGDDVRWQQPDDVPRGATAPAMIVARHVGPVPPGASVAVREVDGRLVAVAVIDGTDHLIARFGPRADYLGRPIVYTVPWADLLRGAA